MQENALSTKILIWILMQDKSHQIFIFKHTKRENSITKEEKVCRYCTISLIFINLIYVIFEIVFVTQVLT